MSVKPVNDKPAVTDATQPIGVLQPLPSTPTDVIPPTPSTPTDVIPPTPSTPTDVIPPTPPTPSTPPTDVTQPIQSNEPKKSDANLNGNVSIAVKSNSLSLLKSAEPRPQQTVSPIQRTSFTNKTGANTRITLTFVSGITATVGIASGMTYPPLGYSISNIASYQINKPVQITPPMIITTYNPIPTPVTYGMNTLKNESNVDMSITLLTASGASASLYLISDNTILINTTNVISYSSAPISIS
jgi:hypothetical protein